MKKIILVILLINISCQKEAVKTQEMMPEISGNQSEVKSNNAELPDYKEPQQWLEHSIENYFSQDDDLSDNMQKMTTKDYYNYKMDAINVDMDVDGSLSLSQFQKKWKEKFDTSKAGVGYGFLISAQDWEKITISKCDFIEGDKTSYLFDVLLEDKHFKMKYPRKIKVVKNGNDFLIADIIEDNTDI